jgi:hypothetical protein
MKKSMFVLFCAAVLFSTGGPSACSCTLYSSYFDLESALSDSLNAGVASDTALKRQIQDTLRSSRLCFFALITAIRADSLRGGPETLTVVRDATYKGTSVPQTFSVINPTNGANCVGSARGLLGKRILCFRPDDAAPTTLQELGVTVSSCVGVMAGTFLTGKRIVSVRYTCGTSGVPCNGYSVSMFTHEIFTDVSIRIAPLRPDYKGPAGIGMSRFHAFTLDGKALGDASIGAGKASQVIVAGISQKSISLYKK